MTVTRRQSGRDSALFCYMCDCNPQSVIIGRIQLYSVICMIVSRSKIYILLYYVICMIITRIQSGKDSALFNYFLLYYYLIILFNSATSMIVTRDGVTYTRSNTNTNTNTMLQNFSNTNTINKNSKLQNNK